MQQKVTTRTERGIVEVTFESRQTKSQVITNTVISINGNVVDRAPNGYTIPGGTHPNSRKIWNLYRIVHESNFTPRRGYGACGCNGEFDFDALKDYQRVESISEHGNNCVTLIEGIQMYYPDLLTEAEYSRARKLLAWHDLGENLYGDHLDDGSQNLAEKDRIELTYFASSIADLPADEREKRLQDFIYFQSPHDSHIPPKSVPYIQLARVVDKLDATLSGLFYEAKGAGGSLDYKGAYHGPLTERDIQSIRETQGRSAIVDTWLVPVLLGCHDLYGFPYALDIVKAAVIQVRREWFPWFDSFCERHQIPTEHVTHPDFISGQQNFQECFYDAPPPDSTLTPQASTHSSRGFLLKTTSP